MLLSFGRFELDPENCRFLDAGSEVLLEQRTFDLLCYFAHHPGKLIRKDELLSNVWHAQTLSDGVLSNTVAKLRKALGQAASARAPIETLYGRGYRFHADVRAVARPPSAAEQPRAVEPAARARDPFVGRRAVLDLLEDCLTQAAGGHGQLVLIAGDAGIGKSRTLAELASRATGRGFSAWQGAAYAGGVTPAYWPWVEIVRAARAELGERFRSHVPSDAWALGHFLPELASVPGREHDARTLRFRLFDELAQLLAAASGEAPRLLVLEDLHFADAATIELLAYLARSLERKPILIAASLREHELARDGSSEAALAHCMRQATHVSLPGLSPSDVAQLVGLLGRAPEEARFSELLHARTGGNPFFVRQVLQLLQQRGDKLSSTQLEAAEVPPAVRDVIAQRLLGLATSSRALMRAAAVIGPVFDAAVLAELVCSELEAVLAGLELPMSMGLLQRCGPTPHRFAFTHALLRDALYDDLGLAPRGRYHSALWQLLAARPAGGDPEQLAAIAHHCLLAVPSDLQACVEHCVRAAQAARESSGFETAALLSERALEKLAAEGGQVEMRCELMLSLSLDQFCAGRIGDALRVLERGARLSRELPTPEPFVRFVGSLANWVDVGCSRADLGALVCDALERARDAAPGTRAKLLAHRAMIDGELAYAERAQLFEEAQRLADEADDPTVKLEVALARVNRRDPIRFEDSRRAVAEYRALTERHPRSVDVTQSKLREFATFLTEHLCAVTEGDLARAEQTAAQCRITADELQVPPLCQAADILYASRALAEGRTGDLSAVVERLRARANLPGGLGLVWSYYSLQLAALRGDRQALAQVQAVVDLSELGQLKPRQRSTSLISVARILLKLGELELTKHLLQEAALSNELLSRMPVEYGDLGLLCALVEIRWGLGDARDAELLEALLAPYAGLNAIGVAFDCCGSVAHYLGLLALLRGRPDEAAKRLRVAQRQNRRMNMPLQLEWTRALLNQALAAAS